MINQRGPVIHKNANPSPRGNHIISSCPFYRNHKALRLDSAGGPPRRRGLLFRPLFSGAEQQSRLSGSVNSPVLGTPDKWERAVLVLLYLACFFQDKVLKAHPCVTVCVHCILFIQSSIIGRVSFFKVSLVKVFNILKKLPDRVPV